MNCDFCYHNCLLKEGQVGVCGVRKNIDGKIVSLNYAQVVAKAVDPIEKKPLYHFLPGSSTYSFALFGCNFACQFCQNHHISQLDSPHYHFNHNKTPPKDLLSEIIRSKSETVSYTYSDPIVWQDYMVDVASLAKEESLNNCMVTNGSFTKSSLQRALKVIDVFNIDLKGSESFYKKYCKASAKAVLESIETIANTPKKFLEVTTLIIEDVHTLDDLKKLASFLVKANVKALHISRFFPSYKMRDFKQTSETFLEDAIKVAQDTGIEFVYGGNSSNTESQNTYCPNCKSLLIKRDYYKTKIVNMNGNRCSSCKAEIYGLFNQ